MERRGLFLRAIQDFRQARVQAGLETITARLTRRSADLLSFDEVRQKLNAWKSSPRVVENIPLNAIVGSVGRYEDYTRSYWPKSDSDEQRWAQIKLAVSDLEGLDPIEVYQIGEVYFVADGNHRVSVFREMGASHIQAYVTKLSTKVHLTPQDDIDDIIIKAEYLDFLEFTQLDKLRPEADIQLSVPGAYKDILDHIRLYQQYFSQNMNHPISREEAVTKWYDNYYQIVINTIRRLGIQRNFPNQTEGDIYMRVWDHRGELMRETNIDVSVDLATQDMADQTAFTLHRKIIQPFNRLLKKWLPVSLTTGPAPGRWREKMTTMQHRKDCLFGYVLVSIGPDPTKQSGLDQALLLAKKENATLYGLHVLPPGISRELLTDKGIQTLFEERCLEAGVEGKFSYTRGRIAKQITQRAQWTDLLVATLTHPPNTGPGINLKTGFDTLVRASPTPVLAVRQQPSQFKRALVAYDASPKAKEALFIAMYMVHRWRTELVILTVQENERPTAEEWEELNTYLSNNQVQPVILKGNPPVAETICKTARDQHCDLILIGGYGKPPLVEMLLGSTVDEVLRSSMLPILVCR